jgi:CRP-like cAMP-binding protein
MTLDPLFARFGREFPEGHVLFREGDAGQCMYVIREGHVRIAKIFATGARTLAVMGPGDFFGEMAILNAKPRSATATALDVVRVLEIDARTLEAMVLGNGEIAVRLISRLARRLDGANALVEILLHRDPRVRVILLLAHVADELGAEPEADGRVSIPITAEEIARSVGLTEAEVRAVIERLARVRLLASPSEGGYLVPGAERLRAFVRLIDPPRGPSLLPVPVHGTEAPPPMQRSAS